MNSIRYLSLFGLCIIACASTAFAKVPYESIYRFHYESHELNRIVQISLIRGMVKDSVYNFVLESDRLVSCLNENDVAPLDWDSDESPCELERHRVLSAWAPVDSYLYDVDLAHPFIYKHYGKTRRALFNLLSYMKTSD
jgi:hypothetical protein